MSIPVKKWSAHRFTNHAAQYSGIGGTAFGCKHCNHVEKTQPRRHWGDVAKARGRMIQHLKAAHGLTGDET